MSRVGIGLVCSLIGILVLMFCAGLYGHHLPRRPIQAGIYRSPPGCPLLSATVGKTIPRACDTDLNRLPFSKYHLYGTRFGDWVRIGNDAYNVSCSDFGGPCSVSGERLGFFAP